MLVLQDAAKPGSVVKKGTPVAEFDRQYMLTRLDDYKAGVAQSEAAFKKLLAEIDVNKKAHEQTIAVAQAEYDKALIDMKTLPVRSAMDAERLRLALEEAQAQLKQLKDEVKFVDSGQKAERRMAELQVDQAKVELKRAEQNAERMVMKAPIDGMVVMQNMFRGADFDQIKVGDQLYPGMMFMQIVDPSSMVINATVSQVDVDKLRIGQKATARFDAFPGLELPARVHAIGSVAKSARYRPDWVKELPVVLKLEKMDPRVIPDLSVSCDVVLSSADAEANVPREAVFTEDFGGGKEPVKYVWVQRPGGQGWEKRQVELVLVSNTHAAVARGIKPDEVVALEPPPDVGAAKTSS